MSYNLQIAICGSMDNTDPTTLCLPSIEHVTLPNFNALKNHVVKHSKWRSFIVLFCDLNGQHSSSVVEDLRKEAHVFSIVIRVKPGSNLTFNGGNVFPVAKQFIMHRITSIAIQFFEMASGNLLKSGNIFFAANFKRQVNALRHQRRTANTTVSACHVLIIPLNVNEDHLFEFLERLINLCNDLCGDYEPIVYTLDAYFHSDENPDLYGNEGVAIKCKFIKKISPIRIYLVGNEMRNLHSFSQPLLENELNDSNEDEYDAKHTFVEYEPVTELTKQNLEHVLGGAWQSTNIVLKRLENIQNDIKFPAALERVNANLRARAVVADVELNQQAMNHSDISIEYSGMMFRPITQPRNGSTEQNNGANREINNTILP